MPARTPLLTLLLALAALGGGCAKKQDKAPPPPPEVIVALPTPQNVTEVEEFTGWTKAAQTVDLRARVTGYLKEVKFKDGEDVQKDDLLFRIDSRPAQAEVDKAEASVLQNEALLDRLASDLRRGRTLATGRAISAEELEKISGSRNEADASVRFAKASLESARLNLAFTKVAAPFSGRISRTMVDPGNLVKADDTILTTLVSLDPIHAYFDVDERTVLKLRRMIQKKMIGSLRDQPITVKIGLADRDNFEIEGKLDFADNQLDYGTGTLRVRATVDNPRPNYPANKTYTLSPGMFVRMQLPVGTAQPSLLLPEEALGSDQGSKFLFVVAPVKPEDVVDEKERAEIASLKPMQLAALGRVEQRKITVGQQEGTMRVIKPLKAPDPKNPDRELVLSELKPGERVIVTGQQRVRAGKLTVAFTEAGMAEWKELKRQEAEEKKANEQKAAH